MADLQIEGKAVGRSSFDTEHLKTDIKGRSLRGAAATILGQAAVYGTQIASTMVLARLLTPADFGLVAMVTAVIGLAHLFGDIGLSTATVQKAQINHEQVSTLFWINVTMGVLVASAIAALAPAVAWFYDEPRLTLMTIALSSVFLLGGLTVQHQALLQRQMRFFARESIRLVSTLAGVGVGIGSALMGAGYWALVMMQAASSLANVIGVWLVAGWWPGRPVRHSGVRSMLVFGGNITGFNVVNYFARNADNILIGRFWGAGPLGFYSKAYGLLMMPLKQINMPLASVAIPALSRLHSDHPRYRAYYLKAISLITIVSTPLVGWLIVCSEDLMSLILGSQWVAASDIFRVLAIAGLIQPLYFTQGWLHISAGRGDRYLRWGLVSSCLIVLGFIAGLPYGPLGVATAYAIVTWGIIVPCMWYAGGSAGIAVGDIFGAVYKNIVAGMGSILISIVFLEHILFPETAWVRILVGLCCICVTYNVFLLALYRDTSPWRQIIDVGASLVRPIMEKSSMSG